MNGIQVTDGADIKNATEDDFVVNTALLGGMKISEVKTFIPQTDATKIDKGNYFKITYAHNLGYIPAAIGFQNGFQGIGWQNSATIFNVSVNTDAQNVYLVADYGQPAVPITLIIFAEQVA